MYSGILMKLPANKTDPAADMNTQTGGCRKIIPNGDVECIWANAGVVPYKLCNFNFDCGNCPFDLVMRGGCEFGSRRVVVRGCDFCSSFFYHRYHTWAKVEGNSLVRIGINDLGQNLLGKIEKISLPGKGEKVHPESIHLTGKRGSVPLIPPLEGYVVEVNEKLRKEPSLANRSPYGDGWVVLLLANRLSKSLGKLLYGPPARRWFEEEVNRLYYILADLPDMTQPEVGITFQDGGVLDFGILDTITPERTRKIMECFFAHYSASRT